MRVMRSYYCGGGRSAATMVAEVMKSGLWLPRAGDAFLAEDCLFLADNFLSGSGDAIIFFCAIW